VNHLTSAFPDFCESAVLQRLIEAISGVISSVLVAETRETAVMVQARLASRTQSRLLKSGLLALFIGALTTAFTVVATVTTAVPGITHIGTMVLKVLNIPDCLSYSDIYRGTQSDFKKEGNLWREYAPNAVAYNYEFKELRRTRDEIILRNMTPRKDVADSASLVVHLPVCGGTAVLTEGLPERSTNLEQVWPDERGS
jgi:hypothetical protein